MISRTFRLVPGEDCGKPNMRGALARVGDPGSRLCYSIIAGMLEVIQRPAHSLFAD
jgi:hypothetical protein